MEKLIRVSIASTKSRHSRPVRLMTSPPSGRSSIAELSRASSRIISRISSSSMEAKDNSQVHWRRCNRHQSEKTSFSPLCARSPNERKRSSSRDNEILLYLRKDHSNSCSSNASGMKRIGQPSDLIDPLGVNPCDAISSTNSPDSVLPPDANS